MRQFTINVTINASRDRVVELFEDRDNLYAEFR